MQQPSEKKPRTVFIEGVWDMMHYNHIEFMVEAAAMGERLVVGVVTDYWASTYKRAPIMTEQERLRTVQALPFVDEAFLFDGPYTAELHKKVCARLGADIVVYGSDGFKEYYQPSIDAGRFVRTQYRPGISTTELIKRILDREQATPS